MNLDDVLRASVDQISRSIEPPMPDPLAIRRRARRELHRRLVVGGSAAAAVVAVAAVSVWQFAGPNGNASPSSPSPSSPSPTASTSSSVPGGAGVAGAVWYSAGVLHDGAKSFHLTGQVATNLAVVADGVLYGDESGQVIYQPLDGSSVVVGRHVALGPAGNPTSDVAVWFEQRPGQTDLVVYDVQQGHEVARANLGGLNVAAPESMVGLQQPPVLWVGGRGSRGTADPAVYFLAGRSLWRYDWASGATSAHRVNTGGSRPSDIANGVWAVAGARTGMTFERSDGTVLSSYSPLEPDGTLSPDGKFYVGYSHGRSVIVDTATGTARPLELGDVQLVMGMTWARGTTVMMRAPDFGSGGRQESIVACDARSLQCESVSPFAPLTEDVLPAF